MKEFLSKNPLHNPPYEIWDGNKDNHQEVFKRMDTIEEALRQNPNNLLVYPSDFKQIPVALLKKIHSSNYIDYLISTQFSEPIPGSLNGGYRYPSVIPSRRSDRSTLQPNGQLGYYSMDLYTPIHQNLWESAFTAASGAYSAATAVLEGDQTSYSIGRPPGHHAGYDYMAGYCYLNNSAIAAYVLSEHGKVGILDIDFHHGNGTEDIFRVLQEDLPDPKILHVSIHANPDRMFPYFSGEITKRDEPLWKGINFALDKGVTNDQYDQILNKALDRIMDFNPAYLVIPVGFDTHHDDPIGDFKLTTDYYEEIAGLIVKQGLPTVFIQEGGYRLETIGLNITSFIDGINKARKAN